MSFRCDTAANEYAFLPSSPTECRRRVRGGVRVSAPAGVARTVSEVTCGRHRTARVRTQKRRSFGRKSLPNLGKRRLCAQPRALPRVNSNCCSNAWKRTTGRDCSRPLLSPPALTATLWLFALRLAQASLNPHLLPPRHSPRLVPVMTNMRCPPVRLLLLVVVPGGGRYCSSAEMRQSRGRTRRRKRSTRPLRTRFCGPRSPGSEPQVRAGQERVGLQTCVRLEPYCGAPWGSEKRVSPGAGGSPCCVKTSEQASNQARRGEPAQKKAWSAWPWQPARSKLGLACHWPPGHFKTRCSERTNGPCTWTCIGREFLVESGPALRAEDRVAAAC